MDCFTFGRTAARRLPLYLQGPALMAVMLGLILSLSACDPGSSGGPGKIVETPVKTPSTVDISAWVGTDDSELTVSSDFSGIDFNLFTYNDPTCAEGSSPFNANCSEQHIINTNPTVIPSDTNLTLSQPAYAHLEVGDVELDTELSAQRFSPRFRHQAVYFKGRFWVVGGNSSDDLWSSADGRNWLRHESRDTTNNKTGLFAFLLHSQLVVFDAPGDGLGEQLWVIGGEKDDTVTNDVWSSSDGILWTLHPIENASTRFTARQDHQVVAFDSDGNGQAELWMLGGRKDGFNESDYLADVWMSTDGVRWEGPKALSNTDKEKDDLFSARYGHQLVVFDGGGGGEQLWLIGGKDPNYYLSDIWSSTNGVDWTDHGNAIKSGTESEDAFNGHQVVVFDDGDGLGPKLWLVGDFTSDVWFSSNGTHWTFAQSNLPFGDNGRTDHQLVVADSDGDGQAELWLSGGGNDNRDSDEVLSSTNGRDWQSQSPYSDFRPRRKHQVVVFDGGDGERFWLVGGEMDDELYSNEVWSSLDGAHWTQQPAKNSVDGEPLFAPRDGHQLVVFDGKDVEGISGKQRLWLIGGDSAEGPLNDIWSSADGIEWTKRDPEGCNDSNLSECIFSGRSEHQVVVFDPEETGNDTNVDQAMLWLVGGNTGSSRSNEVWSSPDGVTWTLHIAINVDTTGQSFSARYGHQLVVFKDTNDEREKLWLFGGYDGSRLNDVWSSANGVLWTEHQPDTNNCSGGCIFSKRYGHQVVVFDPDGESSVQPERLWLTNGVGAQNDIWSSLDGINWTQAENPGAFPPMYHHQMVTYSTNPNAPKELWIIGGLTDDARSNQVWRSSNGTDWRLSVKSKVTVPTSAP